MNQQRPDIEVHVEVTPKENGDDDIHIRASVSFFAAFLIGTLVAMAVSGLLYLVLR